jgi:hypothetical protein
MTSIVVQNKFWCIHALLPRTHDPLYFVGLSQFQYQWQPLQELNWFPSTKLKTWGIFGKDTYIIIQWVVNFKINKINDMI